MKRCKYSLYTGVYSSGWVAEYCVAPLFWLLRQDFLREKSEWAHQPTGQRFLSSLETATSGLGGNLSGSYGQITLTQIPGPTNSFGANSSNTNTSTCLEAPFKAWLCFCTEQKQLSRQFWQLAPKRGIWWEGLVWSPGLTGRLGYLETRKVGMAKPNQKTGGGLPGTLFIHSTSPKCLLTMA